MRPGWGVERKTVHSAGLCARALGVDGGGVVSQHNSQLYPTLRMGERAQLTQAPAWCEQTWLGSSAAYVDCCPTARVDRLAVSLRVTVVVFIMTTVV